MGHHPMGDDVDFNPRFIAERLVDQSAVTMGATAENLHDRFPQPTKDDADAFAVRSQQRAAAAWQDGVMRETVVPMSVFTDEGWSPPTATSSCGRTRRWKDSPTCRRRSGWAGV
jgi:acetyl-CoA acyltransferase